jgi:lipopolysaccharide/colanic/teichoic acid biosynthesis glycosyltransferase
MTRRDAALKRMLDLVLASLLLVPLLPVMALLWLLVRLRDGAPALYRAERVGQHLRPITVWKFRTMRQNGRPESGVSGGDKAHRVTPLGRVLRRSRMDELPQVFNVLGGSMSFVGPRPPIRDYVERFPALYAEILEMPPGITGLATVIFHAREEALLEPTRSEAVTDAVYVRRCIPTKARLDRIHAAHWSVCLDTYILWLTLGKLLPLPGKRAARLRARADRGAAEPGAVGP